jgi:hypothetical protein
MEKKYAWLVIIFLLVNAICAGQNKQQLAKKKRLFFLFR